MKTTKYIWMTFGTISLLIHVVGDYISFEGPFRDVIDAQQTIYGIWGIGTFVMMVIISSTMIFYPEALLISTQPLLKAHNLYKFIEMKPRKPTRIPILGNYHTRVIKYLQSLPEDLLTQIKETLLRINGPLIKLRIIHKIQI